MTENNIQGHSVAYSNKGWFKPCKMIRITVKTHHDQESRSHWQKSMDC